jgi:hypothetical protein
MQRPLWQVFLTGALKMLGCCALGWALPATAIWLTVRVFHPLPSPPETSSSLRGPLDVSAFGFVGAVFGFMAGYYWAVPVSRPREGSESGSDTFRGGERHPHVSEGPLRIVPRHRP